MRVSKEELEKIVQGLAQRLGPDLDYESLRRASIEALKYIHMPSTPTIENDRIVVTGFGLDSSGILANITTYIANQKGNIVDITQSIIQGYFTLILIIDPSNMEIDLQTLKSGLEQLSTKVGVKFDAQRESIFRAMHRV